MKQHREEPRVYKPAALTYREIAAVLKVKHGWQLSTVRVQQICEKIETKLRRLLRNEA